MEAVPTHLIAALGLLGAFAFPLAIGIASGFTHCAAMCGPIHLFLNRHGNSSNMRAYHFGRILTYGGLGAVAGTVGQAWQASTNHHGAWLWVVFYTLLGLKFMGLPLWPASWEARYSRVVLAKMTPFPSSQRGSVSSMLPMGMAAGFLPCASTQAGLAWAAGSGHGLIGAAGMLLLGAGTLPLFVAFPGKLVALRGRYFHVVLGLGLLALAGWKSYGLLFAKTYSCH